MPYVLRHLRLLKKTTALQIALVVASIAFTVMAPKTFAAVGIFKPINYQGKLSATTGVSIANGQYNMKFKIFSAAEGGVALWTETWNTDTARVTSTGGLFSIALGTHTTMTGSVDFNSDSLYLQVEFDPGNDGVYEEVFTPRRRFASVPYAHNANALDGLNGTQFIRSDTEATASGTLTISPRNSRKIGLDILSQGGSSATGALRLSTQGGPHLLFGSGGLNYDTNLYRVSSNTLKTDDALQVVGTLSGSRLVISGNANISGALIVRNLLSGSVIRAQKALTSSGILVVNKRAGSGTGNILIVDTAGLVYDATNKRVGISTASPSARLHVILGTGTTVPTLNAGTVAVFQNNGVGNAVAGISIIGGTTGAGSARVNFGTENTEGIGVIDYQAENNRFAISANGTSMYYTSNGNLMVGTSSVGGSETSTFLLGNGTAPSSSISNGIQVYSADTSGVNGRAGLHIRTEDGTVHVLGTNVGINTTTPRTKLEVNGSMSGVNIFVQTFSGAGLLDCDATTSKIKWDATTEKFSCATDSGLWSNTGSLQTAFDGRYVNTSGDTMTGSLLVQGTLSGRHLIISQTASFSGAIRVVDTARFSSGAVFDTDTLYVDAFNDRVGIGTTAPLAKLHTIGGGTVIDTSGGATTSIGRHFNIVDGVTVTDWRSYEGSTTNAIQILSSATEGFLLVPTKSAAAPRTQLITTGGFELKTGATVGTAGATAIYVDSSRLVGIGTTSPKAKFDVVGTISGARLVISSNASITGSLLVKGNVSGARLTISHNANISGALLVKGVMSGRNLTLSNSASISGAVLVAGTLATKGTLSGQALTVLHGTSYMMGSVGIGTASPSAKLTVTGQSGGNGIMTLTETASSPAGFVAKITRANNDASPTVSEAALVISDHSSNVALHIQDHSSNALFTVLGTGRVGIGTTTPRTKLEVNGSMSGVNIFVQTFSGAGLLDCDATTSKIKWDATTEKFSCGTESGPWSNTGSLQTAFDGRYVNTSGDTMTGSLLVQGTLSGRHLIISQTASFSGAVIAKTNVTVKATLSGSRLVVSGHANISGTLLVRKSVGIGTTNTGSALVIVGSGTHGTTTGGTLRLANLDTTVSIGESFGEFDFHSVDASTNGTGISGFIKNIAINSGVSSALTFGTRPAAGSSYALERLRIDEDGEVGIGTTSPTEKLHVSGALLVYQNGPAGSDNYMLTLQNPTTVADVRSGIQFLVNAAGSAGAKISVANDGVTGGDMSFLTLTGGSDSTRMFIDASTGFIGMGTTAPDTKLDVLGTISGSLITQNGTGSNYFLGDLGIGTTAPLAPLSVKGTAFAPTYNTYTGLHIDSSGVTAGSGSFGVGIEWTRLGDGADTKHVAIAPVQTTTDPDVIGLAFFVSASATNSVDAMEAIRIMPSTGNVGIGTATPVTKFDLAGGDMTIDNGEFIKWNSSVNATRAAIMGDTNENLVFYTGNGLTAGFEKMRITTAGLVGIGSTSPKSKLDVIGTISGANLSVNGYVRVGIFSAATATTVCRTGSGYLAACSSSLRYKEDVQDLDLGLQTLREMRPVDFKWRSRNERDFGFVAEEMAMIDPRLATYNAQGEIEGVKYMQLTAVLANAMKTLDTRLIGITNDAGTILHARAYLTSSGSLSVLGSSTFGSGIVLDTHFEDGNTNAFTINTDVNGSSDTVFRITSSGAVYADGKYNSAGADYAEWFRSSDNLSPGEVVCIDITKKNTVKRCSRDADSNVMGIVSTNPSFVGNVITGADGIMPPGYSLIGLIGQVPAHVIIEGSGSIRAGDSLTAASIPGYARKANAGESTVGVALEAFDGPQGTKSTISVLISRRNSSLTVDAVGQKVLDTISAMKIGDEVQLLVTKATENLNLDSTVTSLVTQQLASLDLTTQINAAIDQRLSGALLQTSQTEEISALTLTQQSLSGSLYIALDHLSTLDSRITALESTLSGSTLHVASALIDHTLTVNGSLHLSGALLLSGTSSIGPINFSGSEVSIGSLMSSGSLKVIGNITITGLATFLGDVDIKGELSVSGKQAGFATIPKSAQSVSVVFSSAFLHTPIVTASADDFGSWRIRSRSQTGFTIELKDPAEQDTLFSWLAISSSDPMETHGAASITQTIPFPVNALGQPVSSDPVWNGCIQGHPVLDADGQPLSCARYHDGFIWQHPDLGISFTYNPNHEPPILLLPEGYIATVVKEIPAEEPTVSPSEPAEDQSEPVVSPSEPSEDQSEPVVSPSEPSEDSSEPDESPSSPSDAPEETPPVTEEADPVPSPIVDGQ